MKTNIRYFLLSLLAAFTLASCDKDGDMIYLDGFGESELIASASDVVLNVGNSKSIVLSLAWKNPTLLSSDSTKPAPNGLLKTYLQASTSEDFANASEASMVNLSKAYTGTELNTLVKVLGLADGVATPVYFRIRSTEGDNMDAAYSNVCKVNVTAYSVKMNRLSVLNAAKTDTLAFLYSEAEDGTYKGFMNATSWMNCWFEENDGTVWGNYAVDGHAFELSNASDAWNCWFGEGNGAWFVTVDTNNEVWSAMNIIEMKLNGNAMKFDQASGTFSYEITTTASNTAISITADGLEYNTTSRDNKDAAVKKALNFAMANGKMDMADASQSATIAEAGTYTVVVSIGEDARLAYEIKSGSVTPDKPEVKFPTELYMCSVDGTETKAVLKQTAEGVYSADYAPTVEWENVKFIDRENDVWYGSVAGDQFALSSEAGQNNIWFNNDFTLGTTLTVTVDLNTMKWSYLKK